MMIFTKFRLNSAKNSNANRMLFVCDIFNINGTKINFYVLRYITTQLFGNNIDILYNISSPMPF